MICEFTFDDGAYVLGALGPAERAAFERHLPTCAPCRDSVSALAVLPGLLGRLDASTAVPSVAAPPSLLRRTLDVAATRRRAQRRRRVWYAVAGGLAAAVLAAGVGVGVHRIDTSVARSTPLAEMRATADRVPVSAQVGLAATEGGTRVDMTCRYAAGPEGKWVIHLVVYPRSGGAGEQIGTWTATSGQQLSLTAITHLTPADIDRVELQRADSTPLLTWTHA
jgi:predicted anti-sigma-YlaC factor YlaD